MNILYFLEDQRGDVKGKLGNGVFRRHQIRTGRLSVEAGFATGKGGYEEPVAVPPGALLRAGMFRPFGAFSARHPIQM